MTEVFHALNDDTRRAVLDLLRAGDLSAGEIAERFNLGKPTMSHHLDLLKRAGLVTSERRGQFVIYSLSTSVLEDAMQWLLALTKRTAAKPSKTPPEPITNAKAKDEPLKDTVQEGVAPAARAGRTIRVPRRRLA